MRSLEVTLVNKDKQKLEHSYEGGEWLALLPSSQDGNDLSR